MNPTSFFLNSLFSLVVGLACQPVGLVLSQIHEPLPLNEKARGLLNHALLMAKSVESGDLLLVEKSSFDTVFHSVSSDGSSTITGVLIDEKKTCRSIFDFANERFLCVTLIEGKIIDFDEPAERRISEWFVGHADFKTDRLIRYGSKRDFSDQLLDNLDRETIFELIGYPELRLGWFSTDNSFQTFQKLQDFIDRDTASSLDKSHVRFRVSELKEQTKLTLTYPMNQGGIDQCHKLLKFGNHGMPVLFQTKYRLADSKSLINEFSIKTDWVENNHIYVPKRVVLQHGAQRNVNRREYSGVVDTTIEMTWQSVNEKIDNKMFEPSNFDSPENVFRLLQIDSTEQTPVESLTSPNPKPDTNRR